MRERKTVGQKKRDEKTDRQNSQHIRARKDEMKWKKKMAKKKKKICELRRRLKTSDKSRRCIIVDSRIRKMQ